MGEVLAANHEPEVAIGNFRKALELYRELAGSADRSVVKDRTTDGFEEALEEVAANAPADLRNEITAELDRMRK